jgi:type II secretory pathway component PulF
MIKKGLQTEHAGFLDKMRSKKGFTVGALMPLAITFVVIAIAIGLGATVLADIQATQTADTVAYNATGSGLESLGTFSGWLPTVALIIIASVIIGIIVVYLAGKRA